MCKIVIADDNELLRTAIRRTLQEEPHMEIVGEATNFAETIQMVGDTKPDILLLDLHLAEKRQILPELVRAQLSSVCTVAISFANDGESIALAQSYGAAALLDKMTLYTEMLPTIRNCCLQLNRPDGLNASA